MAIDQKSVRIKAAELAAQCLQGQLAEGPVGARLMSLCIFFENYIERGSEETEQLMGLLSRKKTKRFRVIAGGAL